MTQTQTKLAKAQERLTKAQDSLAKTQETIGVFFRRKREAAGLSRRQMAEKTQISAAMVQKLEGGVGWTGQHIRNFEKVVG